MKAAWTRARAFTFASLLLLPLIIVFGFFSLNVSQRHLSNSYSKTLEATPERPACDTKLWPNLELFVTSAPKTDAEAELREQLLRSAALFWPIYNFKLVIMTDDVPTGPAFVKRTIEYVHSELNRGFEIRGVFVKWAFQGRGWHQSQWMKFWIDNFTNASYVGMVDTDTLFVTRVTLPDLFRNGKPIVRGNFGGHKADDSSMWRHVASRTLEYTGFKEPLNCMTYFPIIIKASHFKIFRSVILKNLPQFTTFDQAFAYIVKKEYESEFNMMCAVMWNMLRDEYHWIINESPPNWNGPVYPGMVGSLMELGADAAMMGPEPMIAIHASWGATASITDYLRRGVCFSMTSAEVKPSYCADQPDRWKEVNAYEFQFEIDDFSKRNGSFAAHIKRITANEACPHSWLQSQLQKLRKPSD